MPYPIGQKVVAIKKTAGTRDFDTCASYYKRVELNQAYLFVNQLDEESTQLHGETCYWCDADPGMGDRYRESDLIPYTGG